MKKLFALLEVVVSGVVLLALSAVGLVLVVVYLPVEIVRTLIKGLLNVLAALVKGLSLHIKKVERETLGAA